MDDDGYPEERELQEVRQWSMTPDPRERGLALLRYVQERWMYGNDYAVIDEVFLDNACFLTAGWSGNESFVEALQGNRMFWTLWWKSSERGGKHTFKYVGASK